MGPHHDALRMAIEKVRDDFLSEGVSDAATINAGRCGCVVSDVAELLGGLDDFYAMGMSEIGIDGFMNPHPEDECERDGFDRALIAERWPAITPPEGLDWEALDEIAAFANFNAGTHEWIVYEGRHYDAEAPEGVDNPFDLPFFVRIIEAWKLDCSPDVPRV